MDQNWNIFWQETEIYFLSLRVVVIADIQALVRILAGKALSLISQTGETVI